MLIRGREFNIRFWLPIICVIIILLFLPLYYTDIQETDYMYFEYRSVAYTYYIYDFSDVPEISFGNPTRLFAALCMFIPAVYMNYKLAKSPLKHPDRKLGLSVVLGTMVLGWYFSRDFPPWELRWLFDAGYYTTHIRDLDRFCMMIITVLIIIPLLIRETRIVGRLRQNPVETIDNVNTNQKIILENTVKRPSRRYMILGLTLGLIVVIVPVQIYFSELNFLRFPNNAYQYEGYTLFFHFLLDNEPIPYERVSFNFEMISPGDLFNQLPYVGFQLLFIYGVLQYMQGKLSKNRTHLIGVLSLVVPFVYRISAHIAHEMEGEYIIPLPVVLIIGFLVLRAIKPIDSILQSKRKSILLKPRKSISPSQKDGIQVPLLYVVKSRILKLIRRKSAL